MKSLLKRPSAWAPIALSFLALAAMLIYMGVVGAPQPEPDEGTGAHLFQIWLLVEALMIGFFAVKWLPQAPKEAFFILVLQVIAVLLPMSIVFSLGL